MIYLYLAYTIILSAIVIYQVHLLIRRRNLGMFFREKENTEIRDQTGNL